MIPFLTYWLLDTAITGPIPMHWLHPDYADAAMALNRTMHGHTLDALLESLFRLQEHGYLGFYGGRCFNEFDDPPHHLAHDLIATALQEAIWCHYVVTPAGGACWEHMTHPDWARYSWSGGSTAWVIQGGTQLLVDRLIAFHPVLESHTRIVPGSLQRRVLAPWRATYWKTLPVGYEATFTTAPTERELLPYHVHLHQIQEWEALLRWYTNPFPDDT